MTVTFDLNPEIEECLLAQARERGISLGDYLQEIVNKQVISTGDPEPSRKRLIDVLTADSFVGSDLNIQRSKDYPRPIDL